MSKKYSLESLNQALKEVKDGTMTVYKASKHYNIPNQTLYDKVNKKYSMYESAGAPTTLTAQEEGHIVQWVLHMANMGFPVSKDMLVNSVQKLISELDRSNKFKNGVPGRHWYESFMRRHPSLSQRVCQTLTLSRVAVTEGVLKGWFKRVEKYFVEHNLMDVLNDPSRFFNCNESAFFLCPKGQACLAKKGAKTVYSRSGNNTKENLTLLLGGSADGRLMPPMAIFPYQRIPSSILSTYPKSWSIGKSDSGWMTSETFFEYISNVFTPFLTEHYISKPVILFLDGHVSHLSLHLSEYCNKDDIILVALTPNSTHLMQPMDVAVFKPLKTAWSKIVYKWRMENNASRLKRENFAPLLEQAIASSVTSQIIMNGFRKSGLYPFCADAINYNTLVSKSASSTPTVSMSGTSTPRSAYNLEKDVQNAEKEKTFIIMFEELLGSDKLKVFQQSPGEWEGNIEDKNLFYLWKKAKNETSQPVAERSPSLSMYLGDCTLKANECTLTDITLNWPENISELEMIVDKDGTLVAATACSPPSLSQSKEVPFEELVHEVFQEHSTSLKSSFPTPFKNSLLWPETPHSSTKKCIRKKITPTVASSDEFIEHQRRLLNEKKEKMEKAEERKKLREEKKAEKLNQNKIKKAPPRKSNKKDAQEVNQGASFSVGDFVIVSYEEENFPGQVKVFENNKFKIKTMAMSTLVNGRCTWRWPHREDILEYDFKEIIKKIDPPVAVNNRGVFSVDM